MENINIDINSCICEVIACPLSHSHGPRLPTLQQQVVLISVMPNMAHHRIYKFEIEVGPSTEIEFLQLKITFYSSGSSLQLSGLQVMLLGFPTFCEQLFPSQIVC